tara:strand:+ start:10245 stop:11654 length:1410 start_codon:yes stop_codon:yes gene_type:complete
MYLMDRDGALYFRRPVPKELREIVGKNEWKLSLKLKVGQELEAVEPVRSLTRETDGWEREARRQLASGLSKAEMADAAFEWARKADLLKGGLGRRSDFGEFSELDWQIEEIVQRTLRASKVRDEHDLSDADFRPDDLMKLKTLRQGERVVIPCTISMAAENYRKNHKGGKIAKVEQDAVDQWAEFASDKPLNDIRRREVREWIAHLVEERNQSYSTVRRRLNSLTAIVNRAIEDLELNQSNPFAKQRLPKTTSGNVHDCMPFHTTHLESIERQIRESNITLETSVLLRMLRGTTAGPGELSGLEWVDVVLEGDAPHIKIRPNDIRGLKTASRPRDFPLIGDALAAMRGWKGAQKKPLGPVFSERARSINALSQRLNKAIRKAGVPKSRRLVAYSFRHTFEEAMRVAGVELDLQRYLMGHGERSMTDRYGASRPTMERLRAAVEAALPRLGEVDPENYREGELGPSSRAS